MKQRFFWLVKGKHYGAKWHVFETLTQAEHFTQKHFKQFIAKGFEIIQVEESRI